MEGHIVFYADFGLVSKSLYTAFRTMACTVKPSVVPQFVNDLFQSFFCEFKCKRGRMARSQYTFGSPVFSTTSKAMIIEVRSGNLSNNYAWLLPLSWLLKYENRQIIHYIYTCLLFILDFGRNTEHGESRPQVYKFQQKFWISVYTNRQDFSVFPTNLIIKSPSISSNIDTHCNSFIGIISVK